MEYIFHHLSFVFDQKQHTYHFNRSDFAGGLLSKSVFDRVCQYLTTVTQIPLPIDSSALDIDSIMRAMSENYKLPIGYCLCMGFESSMDNSQWQVSDYHELKKDDEENILRPNVDQNTSVE